VVIAALAPRNWLYQRRTTRGKARDTDPARDPLRSRRLAPERLTRTSVANIGGTMPGRTTRSWCIEVMHKMFAAIRKQAVTVTPP